MVSVFDFVNDGGKLEVNAVHNWQPVLVVRSAPG